MRGDANARHAARASEALATYRKRAGREDSATSICDLITDLGHLAQSPNLDFVGLVARAVSIWAYERRLPDGAGAGPQVIVTIAGRKPKPAWPRKDVKP